MSKYCKNPFKFGQRVMVPGRSSSRIVTEIIDNDHIRIMDLVELTPAQREDWSRTPVEGEIMCIPGMKVSVEGVEDWDAYMAAFEKSIGYERCVHCGTPKHGPHHLSCTHWREAA